MCPVVEVDAALTTSSLTNCPTNNEFPIGHDGELVVMVGFTFMLDKILRADRAVVVNALDGVGKQRCDAQHVRLGAARVVKRNRVGENHLVQTAVHDAL